MKPLALALAVALTASAAKGPPWISIETRPMGDAPIVAHTFHHGTPMAIPLSGTAEGIVDGRRVSVQLRFEQDTAQLNAFKVPKTWGATGVWVLNIGTSADYHDGAGVVVGIDRQGQVAFVRFPRNHFGSSRTATAGEVTAMLRALEAGTA